MKRILFVLLSLLPVLVTAQVSGDGCRLAEVRSPEGERMHCYVVHVVNNAYTLRIESQAGSKLYFYRKSAADREEVANASFENNCFELNTPQLNCGYIVEKASGLPDYYWFAQYESVPLPSEQLKVSYDEEVPCELIRVSADTPFATWSFHTPQGVEKPLERQFRISYTDMKYDEETHAFHEEQKEELLTPQQEYLTLYAPLADTSFKLLGDQYTELLGIGYPPLESNMLEAQRIELHALYTIEKSSADTLNNQSRVISAPVELTMQAFANEPAAASYSWRIARGRNTGEEEASIIFRAEGAETSFIFTEMGSYTVMVEAISRSAQCNTSGEQYVIDIAASRLEVPNAFSPFSSPGINDTFRVAHRSLVEFKGYIYNAWGNLLFTWDNPDEGWDATFNGKPVPTGAYYYVIIAKGADGVDYHLKGHVNILGSNMYRNDSTNPNEPNPVP